MKPEETLFDTVRKLSDAAEGKAREVVARFEAERQALALMDHPNVAKVLDAGATDGPLSPSGGRGGAKRPECQTVARPQTI